MFAEIRRFGESSSMKGVPRAIKAQSNVIRSLWIIAVLGLLCVSLAMCIKLISQYISQPRVVKIEDVNALGNVDMSFYLDNVDLFALPDVTVCNHNPLTGYKDIKGVPSWDSYIASLEALGNDLPPALAFKLSQIGYLEALGPQTLVSVNKPEDLIVGCSFGFYGQSVRLPCGPLLITEPVPNVEYSQCYTLRLNNTQLVETYGMAPVSLSLILYLDETSDTVLRHLVEETRDTVGAAITVQERKTLPVLESGIKVSPGQHTVVSISHSSHEKVNNENKGRPCRPVTEEYSTIHNWANVKYKYSTLACMYQQMQNYAHGKCNCISSNLYLLPENVTINELHFCGGSLENITQFQEEMACSQLASQAAIDSMETCDVSCKELVSTYHVTSTKWPSASSQLAFYNKYISGKPYAHYFKTYQDIIDDFQKDGNKSLFLQRLGNQNMIENNFAKVEFKTPTLRATVFSSGYQITIAALIANLGGNLNLWSGISAVILVEVLELFVRLIQNGCKDHPSANVIHITEINPK